MTQPPISPSAFDKIIKAAANVKTKSNIAALNLVLVFLAFIFILFIIDGILKWALTILIFICWQAFAIYVVREAKQTARADDCKIATRTNRT